jgi:hypothetical protein
MRKTKLDPRILQKLREKLKGKISENTVRPAISKIRSDNPALTLNAAAEIFAKKHGFSVSRYLNDKDRDTLKTLQVERIKIASSIPKQRSKITIIAKYDTDDKWLKAHFDEINKTYTYGCYTATFILCRKVLENLIIHHILRKKYPDKSKQHREKYFDFARNRFLDFDRLLINLRNCSNDFNSEKKLVERICDLAEGFKETANEMAHSLYHIASKKEIDDRNFQQILDLIAELEKHDS